eukprot:Clim_evm21s166 gene=Clim_evmTU21s166
MNEESQVLLWSGFYKKTMTERRAQLRLAFPQLEHDRDFGLTDHAADNMVENCIGVGGVPLGLGLNFMINGKSHVVPMMVEEPSVIAAASGAAKLVQKVGGFTATHRNRNVMIGQISLCNVENIENAIDGLKTEKEHIITAANEFCKSMVQRGGGVLDMKVEVKQTRMHQKIKRQKLTNGNGLYHIGDARYKDCDKKFVVVYIYVDVCDAMGANTVNRILEGVAPMVSSIAKADVVVRILSNLCPDRMAKSTFSIPVDAMDYKGMVGEDVAQRILDVFLFADADPYRAVTHNKGIMNGIDAVALACGQDFRAIEAGVHAYVVEKSGYYGPLSNYWIEEDEDGKQYFKGELELPIAVGVQGGAMKTNPLYKYNLSLMGHPDSGELAMIMVSVGLAQNFAALRALATEGIQRGHMSLHAKNIAVAAGAPQHAIEEVTQFMIATSQINYQTAKEYLRAHALLKNLATPAHETAVGKAPSLFYYDDTEPESGTRCTLHIAFHTLRGKPALIAFDEDTNNLLHLTLFTKKGHSWLRAIRNSLTAVKILPKKYGRRVNTALQLRLKTLSILMNVLAYRLLMLYPDITKAFLKQALGQKTRRSGEATNALRKSGNGNDSTADVPGDTSPSDHYMLEFQHNLVFQNDVLELLNDECAEEAALGLSLLLSMWQVFYSQVDEYVGSSTLSMILKDEQARILASLVQQPQGSLPVDTLEAYIDIHSRRFQVSVFLLVDAVALDEDSELLTPEKINLLLRIGRLLEWEGSMVHDIARYERDVSMGMPNAYAFWLDKEGKTHSPESVAGFNHTVMSMVARDRVGMAKENDLSFFDQESFDRSLNVMREYYNLPQLISSTQLLNKQ